jgi:hypothetical protein
MGNLKIFEEIMIVQSCKNFEKLNFHAKLFENKHLSLIICPQTGLSKFLSLTLNNFAASMEKCHFFPKKGQKI